MADFRFAFTLRGSVNTLPYIFYSKCNLKHLSSYNNTYNFIFASKYFKLDFTVNFYSSIMVLCSSVFICLYWIMVQECFIMNHLSGLLGVVSLVFRRCVYMNVNMIDFPLDTWRNSHWLTLDPMRPITSHIYRELAYHSYGLPHL